MEHVFEGAEMAQKLRFRIQAVHPCSRAQKTKMVEEGKCWFTLSAPGSHCKANEEDF